MIMPSPGEDLYMIGSYGATSATQLASSQLTQYFTDLQVGSNTSRSIFPLRTHGSMSPGERSPTAVVPNMILTQSILNRRISRSGRPSIERADSVEDGSNSGGDSDEVYTNCQIALRDPLARNRRRRSHNIVPSILKNYGLPDHPKKKVQFADDLGFDLARVCLFAHDEFVSWEPDPVPREDYFRSSGKPLVNDDDLIVDISEWQVNFSQPAADYLGFREKLEADNVALENVFIKQKTNSFMGTVKVKNIAFKKDVFIRCTFNSWETFSDFPAKFVGKGSEADIYDTFSFEIVIPAEAEERHLLEFCAVFRTDGKEFWDSNKGKNYQLITSHMKRRKSSEKHQDAYAIQTPQVWTEFASWNQLENSQPYW